VGIPKVSTNEKGSHMATKKEDTKIRFRTPLGRARYPHLNKVDALDDKWKTGLILSPEDAKTLMATCQELGNEVFGSKAKLRMPWTIDEETGDIILKLKTKFQPRFVDSTASPVLPENVPEIWGGSSLKVAGVVGSYEMSALNRGVNLQLTSVQLIEVISGGNRGGEELGDEGFEPVKDGFVAKSPTSSPNSNKDLGGDNLDDFTDF